MSDKLRVAGLRGKVMPPALRSGDSLTTADYLKSCGFSEDMIAKFFRPFLSGIFLENELNTASSMFDFVFEMLSKGDNVLPSRGMQAIPEQMALSLPQENLLLNCGVKELSGRMVTLSSGQKFEGTATVIATEEMHAMSLLGQKEPVECASQVCVYFAADKPPIKEPVLILNGEGRGLVNNFCVPSLVADTYAPPGKFLLSASLVGDNAIPEADLQAAVRSQMGDWFGGQVDSWEYLRTYRIKYALPDQSPRAMASRNRNYNSESGIYTCGDYKETGSINGAMLSGRKAAEALIESLCCQLRNSCC
jgi:phytoene dehydrogenase-like protein